MLVVTAISVALYLWFLKSSYYHGFYEWVSSNTTTFILFLLFFKILSIIWPPLTGGVATLAAIPLIGWFPAYLTDLTGSLMGGAIAYFLGQKYGIALLNKLFDRKIVEKIEKIKVIKGREIEAVIIYRIIFGFTILEAIYYGAGLLKVQFNRFMLGAFISHIIVGVPTYFTAKSVISSTNTFLVIASLLLGVPLFLYFRKRHFEL